MNIKIATKLLLNRDMLVDVAENGQIGVDKFTKSENGYYDVILMDIRMPIMDGLSATVEIRKSNHPQSKTIPIIAMTANALTDDIEKTTAVGMNEHLSKPIDIQKLYQTLAKQIENVGN